MQWEHEATVQNWITCPLGWHNIVVWITEKASLQDWSHIKYLFWDLTTETIVWRWSDDTVKQNCRIEGQNLRDEARMVVCYYRKRVTRKLITNKISLLRPHMESILCWDDMRNLKDWSTDQIKCEEYEYRWPNLQQIARLVSSSCNKLPETRHKLVTESNTSVVQRSSSVR